MEICSESGYGIVDGVGGHTECLRDGICLESRSLQSPTLSGRSLADYQRTTSKLPPENYMKIHIIFRWLFGGCSVAVSPDN